MFQKLRYICLFCFISVPIALHATGEKISTLVIDAGHGGKDAGAVGKKHYEKNIALAVTLKFGQLVSDNFTDVKVIYTRKDDRFIELRQRAKIANQNHADLFVSIHCNSTENTTAKGVETWIMGSHKNETNLKVAQLENSVILKEQDHEENYANFNPNSPDAYIIFSLYQNAFMDQSLNFAARIQDQYINRISTPDRGIKQAGFLVLWACALPAVLTEIGFISNLEEERFLGSEEGQNHVAMSLFNAFKEYKYQIEGFNNQTAHAETPSPNVIIPSEKSVKITESLPPESKPMKASEAEVKTDLVFKIQFATSSKEKDLKSPEFHNLPLPSKYVESGLYKYCCGEASTLQEAQKVLQQVQSAGYRDAFMVVFQNGQKISTQEANRILQEQNK